MADERDEGGRTQESALIKADRAADSALEGQKKVLNL